eukprot:TRINITY_DN10235_c0_g1_i1.p1 TRINITY_DN10235_c0_g1~~TRINITY_DN10235_c0_g1_i1.p1  ORF type:complete len:878 (+),score=197.93 TRINITY_DN10235_c0_g1_i1:302-2935(+)
MPLSPVCKVPTCCISLLSRRLYASIRAAPCVKLFKGKVVVQQGCLFAPLSNSTLLQRLFIARSLSKGTSVQKIASMATSSRHGGPAQEEPEHTNRLAQEQSPYLLQHAHNPVDWYPWGDEAFAKARAEKKPIFLSVGYSTCHWCHVMEVESFENEKVAELLNKYFVAVKVDREERPDVDKIYMTYHQLSEGSGGWPLSVFLTPSLEPFFAGTYFPPEDKWGRLGFKSLLQKLHEAWKDKQEELERGGTTNMRLVAKVMATAASSRGIEESKAEQAVKTCAETLSEQFDSRHGGFGGPPKFPRPSELNLLLRYQNHLLLQPQLPERDTEEDMEEERQRLLHMACFTLEMMAKGGVNDQIGGGFHRYSVDEYWHVPHFEKMLYDQGQLANAYLDAFAITGNPRFAHSVRSILDYLRRDMTHPNGGIFSAEDADSLDIIVGKKKEGVFYVWTKEEIEQVLGPERADPFCKLYAVKKEGNCTLSKRSDPHKEFVGQNVLIERKALADVAKEFGIPEEKLAVQLGEDRKKLFEHRAKRTRPHLDDKIIVAWNGLAISAFSRASRGLPLIQSTEDVSEADAMHKQQQPHFPAETLDPREYLTAAAKAATFIKANLFDPSSKALKRSFRKQPSAAAGFLDDYAFLIAGLLDLYEAGGEVRWLEWALELQETQDALLWDADGGGYFTVPLGDPSILVRMKDDADMAEPAGNSIACANLVRLASMLQLGASKAEEFLAKAQHTVALFGSRLEKAPTAVPQLCCSIDLMISPAKRQIIVAGQNGAPDTDALVRTVFGAGYQPHLVMLQVDVNNEDDRRFWGSHNPNVLKMAESGPKDKAVAFVCQDFTCQAPTSDPGKLQDLLQKRPGQGGKGQPAPFDLSAALGRK